MPSRASAPERTPNLRPARLGVALLLGASVALAACSKKTEEPTPSKPVETTKAEKKDAAVASAEGSAKPPRPERLSRAEASARAEEAMKSQLKWDDPSAWRRNKPSNPMRIAEYAVPKRGKDPEDAEVVVNTFAGGPGNTVEANIDRWVRQFDPKDSKEQPVKKDREVNGFKVHVVTLNGTYKGMMMPGAAAKAKTNYRLVGAVVEVGTGLWFFKMTGPEATVKAAEADFDKLIGSIKKNEEKEGGAP
jgi:hypothetical protein